MTSVANFSAAAYLGIRLSQGAISRHRHAIYFLIFIIFSSSFSIRLHPPMIAVGSDEPNTTSGGKVFIYEYSESSRRWAKTETLSMIDHPVHDIAFAPNLGRSYHTLAVATKGVRIITLNPLP